LIYVASIILVTLSSVLLVILEAQAQTEYFLLRDLGSVKGHCVVLPLDELFAGEATKHRRFDYISGRLDRSRFLSPRVGGGARVKEF
jgi:hypothetical protein